MSKDKIYKKIIKNIKEDKLLDQKTIKEFCELDKEEIKSVLMEIIDQEHDSKIKKKLIDIYHQSHWMHDKNLLLLSIWSAHSKLQN